MDCVNHSGKSVAAYCQHCGKPLCTECTRSVPGGQIFCEPCWNAWQASQQAFVAPPVGAPSPGLAALLGFIPGVGAMYNGQFLKGLVHVLVFAVLVSAAHVYDVFGLFIAGWIFYQVFEAYHTAKARRDGEPLPDPLGLNDIGNWFGVAPKPQPGPPPGSGVGPSAAGPAGPYQAPFQTPYQQSPNPQGGWQSTYQGQAPTQPDPTAGPGVAPGPPVPPMYWRRKEPIGAIILIAFGVLFLLDRFDLFSGRIFAFSWPLVLIGLGVWLIIRRFGDVQGGPK